MDHNWAYVGAGYLLCAGVLGGYVGLLRRRLARARRAGRPDGDR
jgi:hypothetical protein